MKVALLYDHPRWEERYLISKIEELGHEAKPIPLHSTVLPLHEKENLADVALQRSVSSFKAYASTASFEAYGIPVVNSLFTHMACDNKAITSALLLKHNVPQPKTIIAFSREGAIEAAEKLGYPLVIKPIHGSWGRLLALVKDRESLFSVLEHREAMPNPQYKVHYLQEFVEKPGRDIRVFVVGDRVATAIYRVSENWRTNTALGGKAVPAEVDQELEEVSIKAAEALGGGVLGVDVVEDKDRGYLVVEVNAVVEFKNTIRVTGYDLGKDIVEYAVSIAKR